MAIIYKIITFPILACNTANTKAMRFLKIKYNNNNNNNRKKEKKKRRRRRNAVIFKLKLICKRHIR